MISKLVRASFQKYPVISNAVTYTGLYLTAEVSQQLITKKVLLENRITHLLTTMGQAEGPGQPLDISILGRYAVWGSCVGSHMLYFWYRWLDKTYAGTATKIVAKKVLLDQFFMTPLLLTSFYITMAALEQREEQGLLDEFKDKFVQTFRMSCMFWIPVQTVNFLLIPPVGRVVYVGFASLAWANILCYIKRQPNKSQAIAQ